LLPIPKEGVKMRVSVSHLVARARDEIDNVDPEQMAREVADGVLVVDIREASERDETGAIPGAVHVPRGLLEFKADTSLPTHHPDLDPNRRTILYCASGGRSALAVLTLEHLGYTDVAHLDGGIQGWIVAGRSTEITD
jgi:rhodanese-related sulfurtransferase